MRLFKFVLILAAMLALASPAIVHAAGDPNLPDTLRVDSVTSFVSGIGIVPVTFFNDEDLTQIEVTLRHNSNQVRIDSFSFAGGRLLSAGMHGSLLNTDSTIVTVYAILAGDTIPPGDGLLGKLYLSYSQTISPQVVQVDSTTWVVPPLILHSTSFHAPGVTFKPQFIPGYLDIRATPQSLDSVWVARIEARPGDQVAVDVYAFNERNLSEIALALSYGTANLALDSVSFVGTRSVAAPTKTVQTQPDFQTLYATMEFSPAAPLAPGSGPVARLHFTIAPETPEGTIVVDSTTVGINYKTRFWLTATDGSIDFVPLFYSGSIKVTTQTDVEDITDPGNLPTEYNLAQNYPNPFNPTTTIELSLPRSGHVEVEVFNILGRRVSRLIDRELPAGTHRIIFDGRGDDGSALATGVYFYRITSGDFRDSKKMLLVK